MITERCPKDTVLFSTHIIIGAIIGDILTNNATKIYDMNNKSNRNITIGFVVYRACYLGRPAMPNALIPLSISEGERTKLINQLVDELPVLRTKLGISQDEMAGMLGITRQTYSTIETKRRKMSWAVYLSLILIFDNSEQTHEYIRQSGLFPNGILSRHHLPTNGLPISSFIQMDNDDIRNHLDEQAIHAIETVILVEYARCNGLSGDAVVKAFDGKRLSQITENDVKATTALKSIKTKAGRK